MDTTKRVGLEMTINEVTRAWPETLPVFQRLGLDTCCGGPLPVGEAADRHGLDRAAVLAALEESLG